MRERRRGTPAAVLTVSDGVFSGNRDDVSGEVLASLLGAEGFRVQRRTVPDESDAICDAITELASEVSLVLTTGGTGMAPRDVTPEATLQVIDKDVPGIAEALRADAARRTPHAMLSRGLAGIRDRTLVINFPGSPGACRDGFAVVLPALDHALSLLADEETAHRQT